MSGSVFSIGLSGLQAAQAGLRTASQNIANANTPGYVRAEVDTASLSLGGAPGGVKVEGVRRAVDTFLAQAMNTASATAGANRERASFLDRAQASFGDPGADTSVFAYVDRAFNAFAQLSLDPASSLRRDVTVDAVQTAFGEIARVAAEVQALAAEADQRISQGVTRAQELMEGIARLNASLSVAASGGGDISSGENVRSQMLDELAQLVDIRVANSRPGVVEVRTNSGVLLVGAQAAQLSHAPRGGAYASYEPITIVDASGASLSFEAAISSGSLKGLLQARDTDLRGIAEALGELTGGLAEGLNAAHADSSTVPAPPSLTGRNTGLLAADALNFTGKAVIGLIDPQGALSDRLTIDFSAGTITTLSPAASYTFSNRIADDPLSPGSSFVEQLNAALGASGGGSASFAGGVMTLTAGGARGIVVQQDQADPSARAGKGFAHAFGLNDLARSTRPLNAQPGLSATDAHGLQAGGEITFRITDPRGKVVAEPTIAISGALAAPGSTWGDLVTALNDPTTGLGAFASFGFNVTTGAITMSGANGFTPSILSDGTQRGATGAPATELFGLSFAARAARATETNVRTDVRSDPAKLALARPDLSGGLGSAALFVGDGRGASALEAVRNATREFGSAGALAAQTASVATYLSRLGGEAGRMASEAARNERSAAAIATVATDRRAAAEGVSIDDEMIKLTSYQQAYAAAARVIQAATEMYDTLLRLGA